MEPQPRHLNALQESRNHGAACRPRSQARRQRRVTGGSQPEPSPLDPEGRLPSSNVGELPAKGALDGCAQRLVVFLEGLRLQPVAVAS